MKSNIRYSLILFLNNKNRQTVRILLGCGLFVVLFFSVFMCGCAAKEATGSYAACPQYVESMQLEYATKFSVDFYTDGYEHIHIADGDDYILVPENGEENNLGYGNAVFIHKPVSNIYLAASATMDLFKEIDALDYITACSTKAEDYVIEGISEKIQSEDILYVGKYSAPDFDLLLARDTKLAIESTMINHSPKVKEKLESLKISVLTDYSSYEENPLGRLEWIKLYGVLCDKRKIAEDYYEAQVNLINEIISDVEAKNADEKPKIVFFYVSSNGYINVRKPGDYISKMISIAGGEYSLESLKIDEENALSTVNISWEDFYTYAKDADILIYNSTTAGKIDSVKDLVDKNSLFEDFKAVQNKKVFCTSQNMYQESSKIGEIILDFSRIINDRYDELEFMEKLD